MTEVLPWEEGRALLLREAAPLPPLKVPLREAAGRVLAEEIVSGAPFPPFARSLVDGYALGPAAAGYRLVGEVPAGSRYPGSLAAGEAVRIFTGAPVPPGTVTVLPQEVVELREDGRLEIPASPVGLPPRGCLQVAGSEVRAGEKVLTPGTVLGPAEIGLLSALGREEVWVHPEPRVALAAVGTELKELVDRTDREGLVASNLYALEAAFRLAGVEVHTLPVLPDRMPALMGALEPWLDKADLVITTGGAGGGDYDLAARSFRGLGARLLFTRLNYRPGGGVIGARRGQTLLLGLPGTSSALAGFYLLARPVVEALGGKPPGPRRCRGKLEGPVVRERRTRTFIFAEAQNDGGLWRAAPVNEGRGPLLAALGANALLDVPPGKEPIPAGTEVDLILL
ncbi:MAG: molybdopterin molybdotransferase MoeA [Thermoanaerobacteraceae bacterium]|nr:molybdopterin molybdotransferase MoeA [Thermoanaerobacteraceae bacterium]